MALEDVHPLDARRIAYEYGQDAGLDESVDTNRLMAVLASGTARATGDEDWDDLYECGLAVLLQQWAKHARATGMLPDAPIKDDDRPIVMKFVEKVAAAEHPAEIVHYCRSGADGLLIPVRRVVDGQHR